MLQANSQMSSCLSMISNVHRVSFSSDCVDFVHFRDRLLHLFHQIHFCCISGQLAIKGMTTLIAVLSSNQFGIEPEPLGATISQRSKRISKYPA
jgi:hypothetical protein